MGLLEQTLFEQIIEPPQPPPFYCVDDVPIGKELGCKISPSLKSVSITESDETESDFHDDSQDLDLSDSPTNSLKRPGSPLTGGPPEKIQKSPGSKIHCEVCKKDISQTNFAKHLKTQQHKNLIPLSKQGQSSPKQPTKSPEEELAETTKGRKRIRSSSYDEDEEPPMKIQKVVPTEAPKVHCAVCKKDISQSNISKHLKTQKHKDAELYHKQKSKSRSKTDPTYAHCGPCDKPLRDQDHVTRHLKSQDHQAIILDDHPEYLTLEGDIDETKIFNMIQKNNKQQTKKEKT